MQRNGTQVIYVGFHGRGEETKKALASLYAKMGVAEIDMVMNYGLARGEQWDLLREEIACVVQEAHQHNVLVKVIIEASELSQEQMIKSVHACISAGADYAKSSTGFSKGGSTPKCARCWRQLMGRSNKAVRWNPQQEDSAGLHTRRG